MQEKMKREVWEYQKINNIKVEKEFNQLMKKTTTHEVKKEKSESINKHHSNYKNFDSMSNLNPK